MELGHPEGDTCHVLVDPPKVQVHEVRKVGRHEHLVILCLGDGVPREAERSQVLESPQVDDLGRTGKKIQFRGCAAFSLALCQSCSLATTPVQSRVTGEEGTRRSRLVAVPRPLVRPGLSKGSANLGSNASCEPHFPHL